MKASYIIAGLVLAGIASQTAIVGGAFAQPAAPAPTVPIPAAAPDALAAGNFAAHKTAPGKFHLVVAGHVLTGKDDIEKFMAFRAATLTMQQGFGWFELIEHRAAGDTVPVAKGDPSGPRFSFRMDNWRPVWRYKVTGSPAWKSWSPFSGKPFPVTDPKTVSDYEVSADIVLHKGMVDGVNPRAFDAPSLSDFLVNQAIPAK